MPDPSSLDDWARETAQMIITGLLREEGWDLSNCESDEEITTRRLVLTLKKAVSSPHILDKIKLAHLNATYAMIAVERGDCQKAVRRLSPALELLANIIIDIAYGDIIARSGKP